MNCTNSSRLFSSKHLLFFICQAALPPPTMATSNFLTLRSSFCKPSTRPFFLNPIKNFGQSTRGTNHRVEERAPSTAEEFQRVAEEKAREAKQGIASQTTDKTYDTAEEASVADSNVGSVKNRYKEHEPGTDYGRTGN